MLTDAQLLDALAEYLSGCKWSDTLPDLRPVDDLGEYTEKHIDKATFKQHLQQAFAAKAAK